MFNFRSGIRHCVKLVAENLLRDRDKFNKIVHRFSEEANIHTVNNKIGEGRAYSIYKEHIVIAVPYSASIPEANSRLYAAFGVLQMKVTAEWSVMCFVFSRTRVRFPVLQVGCLSLTQRSCWRVVYKSPSSRRHKYVTLTHQFHMYSIKNI